MKLGMVLSRPTQHLSALPVWQPAIDDPEVAEPERRLVFCILRMHMRPGMIVKANANDDPSPTA